MLSQIESKSRNIDHDDSKSIHLRIFKSKRLTKKGIKKATQFLNEKSCDFNSDLIGKIIEFELKLGKKRKAKKLALKRLNKFNPNWKKDNSRVPNQYLSILVRINSTKKSRSYYRILRKHKGRYAVCGTTTHAQDVRFIFNQADILKNDYGEVYSSKFLQGSTLLINEDCEYANLYWDEIYKIIVESLLSNFTPDQIKYEYENSKVKKNELEKWEKDYWMTELGKSEYYFDLFDFRIYFKTDNCSSEKNKLKRCSPVDLQIKKEESSLFEIIMKNAS